MLLQVGIRYIVACEHIGESERGRGRGGGREEGKKGGKKGEREGAQFEEEWENRAEEGGTGVEERGKV